MISKIVVKYNFKNHTFSCLLFCKIREVLMLKVYCFYLISLLLFFFIVWFLLNWIQSNKPTFTLRALVLNSDFFCSHCCHMAARCASVPKLLFFPAELGYFFTVAAGCFSILWVEATPLMQYLPHPSPEHNWASFGLVLRSNWADFVVKTWQPCSYRSFAHVGQFRTMICLHWKSDIGHI